MNLISYSADNCIRNAYYHNSCSNCVDICPENLFEVFQNRIKFDANLCTYCSACLGVCPTEAITIESFDPNRFTLEFKFYKDDKLDCKNMTRCLSAFDTNHFTAMLLERESLKCDLSLCSECDMGNLKTSIKDRISDSNLFLENLKSSKRIEIIEDKVEETSSKRELFNKIIGKTADKILIPDSEKERINKIIFKDSNIKRMLPTKQRIFIETLRASDEFEKIEKLPALDSLVNSKDFDKICTNCGDCIQFCPTEALFYSSDMLSIYVSASKCIGCGICQDICKVDAILKSEEINIIDFLRPKQLLSFSMDTCIECKTSFIKRGDEVICERCIDFTANFSSMLSLARDL